MIRLHSTLCLRENPITVRYDCNDNSGVKKVLIVTQIRDELQDEVIGIDILKLKHYSQRTHGCLFPKEVQWVPLNIIPSMHEKIMILSRIFFYLIII